MGKERHVTLVSKAVQPKQVQVHGSGLRIVSSPFSPSLSRHLSPATSIINADKLSASPPTRFRVD